jgi:hypothetical protein
MAMQITSLDQLPRQIGPLELNYSTKESSRGVGVSPVTAVRYGNSVKVEFPDSDLERIGLHTFGEVGKFMLSYRSEYGTSTPSA